MSTKHCHFLADKISSLVTGREIYINRSSKFAISHNLQISDLNNVNNEWKEYIEYLKSKRNSRPASFGYFRSSENVVDACLSANTKEEFADALDALVLLLEAVEARAAGSDYREDGKSRRGRRSGEARRLIEVLVLLWKRGILMFPAAELWVAKLVFSHSLPPVQERYFGSLAGLLSEMREGVKWSGNRPLIMLILSTSGVVEAGDIDSAIVEAVRPFSFSSPMHGVFVPFDRLLAAQRRVYRNDAPKLSKLPQSYRALFPQRKLTRSDPQFMWSLKRGGAILEEWRAKVAQYVSCITNRVNLRYEVTILNRILDYVIANEDVPAHPLEYCRRSFVPRQSFANFLENETRQNLTGRASVLRMTSRMFTWILKTDGLDGDGELSRGYWNPIDPDDIPTQEGARGQTHRNAIPVRFLRMMRDIIESPDSEGRPTFAWPKTLAADYFTWIDPASGASQRIWSPVRAEFYLLRLMLPIRGLQTRLLDSGEGDAEVYRPEKGGWVDNDSRLITKHRKKKRNNGFIRKIWDHNAGRSYNGLYITTNKTADRDGLFIENGYEIPWTNQEVIDLFCRMRDWQERHNPCLRPVSRAELNDTRLIVSQDVADRIDKLYFLFRDAADPSHPQEPPSDGRLKTFWCALLDELERRLAASGQANNDGSRIVLITARKHNGFPKACVFDPHSLRVSGLTALAGAGVPIHILSQFVAGHATSLMTIYYQKPGAAKITESLDEAWNKLSETESRDWDAYLNGLPLEIIHDMEVYNSQDGVRTANNTQSALWAPMDDGICPAGGAKCSVGGPLLYKARAVFAPVPGGARNCPLCRFFVTGPRYLVGLVAKYNALGGEIREKLSHLAEAEKRRRELAGAALLAIQQGQSSPEHARLARAEEAIQDIQEGIELLSQTWVAQLKLILRIEAVIKERIVKNSTASALVLNGSVADFRVAIEECSEFDLWDRICQSSEFYPSVDARLPALRRARLYDTMLTRQGKEAIFLTLTDEQILYVGNDWANFLKVKLGDARRNDLIVGRETMRSLGIEDEFKDMIAGSLATRLVPRPPALGVLR